MMQYIDTTLIRKFQRRDDEPVIIESLYNGRTEALREMVELERLDDDMAWENGRQVIGAHDLCKLIHATQIDYPEFGENIYLDFTEGKESLTGLRLLSPGEKSHPDTLTPLLDRYYQTHQWEEMDAVDPENEDHGTIYHHSYDVWEEKVLTDTLWKNRIEAGQHTSHDLTSCAPWSENELDAVPRHLDRTILPGRELTALGYSASMPCYLRENDEDGTTEMTVIDENSTVRIYRLNLD